jgi:cellulose synthase/poly-beta-1,6-N-acetylglucosamine synthase-like glycosyltransferase
MIRTTSVTVIIPTFRRLDILKKCLEGVFALDHQPNQILVVFRPEDDQETAHWLINEACPFYPKLQIVPVLKPGVVAALNAGLGKAESEIIAIFDDDAVPRPDCLSRILAHFVEADVGAVGGRDVIHGFNFTHEVARAGFRNWWGKIIGHHELVIGDPRQVEVLKGCNWALRHTAIGSLQLDERLLGVGAQVANEWWYCLNIRKANWKIILDPSAIVDHYPAVKPDYSRTEFCKKRCYETTHNDTATMLAFTSWHLRLRYLLFHILVGNRTCPGLYFIAHSLLKRPCSLPGQLAGGWSGFFHGWKMAREFEFNPPGLPNTPPSVKFQ